jgi:hypothetical protein
MMASAYFWRCSFASVEFLPMGQKDNSQFFTEAVLPSTEKKPADCRLKLQTTTVTYLLKTPNRTHRECSLQRLKS